MKKIIYLLVVVSVVWLISGCGGLPGKKIVFDPDLPEENATIVVFSKEIEVMQYNGIDVYDTWYPTKFLRKNTVTLPAGPTTIVLNLVMIIKTGNTNKYIEKDNITLRFDFEAGKEYYVGANAEVAGLGGLILGKRIIGIGVWSGSRNDDNKDRAIKYWELGEVW